MQEKQNISHILFRRCLNPTLTLLHIVASNENLQSFKIYFHSNILQPIKKFDTHTHTPSNYSHYLLNLILIN